jgi:hypothetical protein
VQTLPRLAWSRKSACGNATEARAMLASPGRAVRIARSFGCLARRVLPKRRIFSFGLEGELVAVLCLECVADGEGENAAGLVGSDPPPLITPAVAALSQLVPLSVNSLRLRLRKIERMSSLVPP